MRRACRERLRFSGCCAKQMELTNGGANNQPQPFVNAQGAGSALNKERTRRRSEESELTVDTSS